MGKNNHRCFIIINPHAGNGKGRKDWPLIESSLKKENLEFDYCFTEKKYHAIKLTTEAIENGYKKIIAVGGDGTLNEIVNGIFLKRAGADLMVGMIPVGSGNDWCRMYGIPSDYKMAVKIIKEEKIFVQDIGLVKYQTENKFSERYFTNVAGMGFDAKVVKKTNIQKDKGRGGKMLYLLNLFTSLFSNSFVKAEIIIDENKINAELFSMNVGICKYSGGGMMQVPNALADDGIFDVTIIRKIGKLEVIRNVKNLYDGSFTKNPKVSTYRGVKIKVASDPPVMLEADGETLGESPLEFSIIQRALKIISA